MNTIGEQGTATIFHFPIGGRAGLSPSGFRSAPHREPVVVPPAAAIDWRGWYHAEAVTIGEPVDRH